MGDTVLFSAPSRKASCLKKMNFYSKFVIFASFTAHAVIIHNPIHLLPFVFLGLVLCLISGVSIKTLFGMAKAVMGIFLFLFIFSAFIYDVDAAHTDMARKIFVMIWQNDFIKFGLTSGGMLTGLSFILKMLILILASNLFMQTTTMEEILFGMNRIGLPYQFGLMLSIALRFIPTFKKEVSQIQQAQKSRGASNKRKADGKKGNAVKGVIPLFVPMIVSSMRRSDTIAMSMTSRGYGFTPKRTRLLEIKFGILQILFCIFFVCVFAVSLYAKSTWQFGLL